MGSIFSSSHYRQGLHSNNSPINQMYNVEFGYAPVGPIGTIASVPKRRLYNSVAHHHHRRRY
jgi:hypothetical protein